MIAPSFVVSYSHPTPTRPHLEAIDGALGVYAKAMEDGVERIWSAEP